ncbi:HNH endonuclease domain-containing protein [Duganella vulcania]|uniref:HNH nuclease domain-containing protein n=1 Tax=Duganella vulcania TaxID=2692166 RepID=A0A845GW81_9BURK|nr:HNH endonuclease domain-containing protein [Duganella vulcania]MYM96927.1 hypothetical protein [Duganella vulcania]
MIKLQLHLSEDDVNSKKLVGNLLNAHWDFLNKRYARKPYSLQKYSLIRKCEDAIENLKKPGHRKDNGLSDDGAHSLSTFLVEILKTDQELLKKIILSDPENLLKLTKEIKIILQDDLLFSKTKNGYAQTSVGIYLSEIIFDYKNFRNSNQCATMFREGMNSNLFSCPYCNLNKITITDMSKSKEEDPTAYLDLDHFFPKSRYPYFAVSFYNLVPSCHDCNSREKGAKEFDLHTHIHPYVESFDDHYIFSINTDDFFEGEITIEGRLRDKNVRNDKSMSDLNLIDRYQADVTQIKAVLSYYKSRFSKMKLDPAEYIDFFTSHFSFRRSEILRSPQSKLLRDVVAQIDEENLLQIMK